MWILLFPKKERINCDDLSKMKQIAPYVKEHVSTLESIVPYRMVFRYQSTAGSTDLFSV